MLPHKKRMLYLMHINWFWIKQRPQFLAENLSHLLNLKVIFTESIISKRYFFTAKKPSFVKSVKLLPFERYSFIRNLNKKVIKIQLRNQIRGSELIWFTSPSYYDLIKEYIKPTQTVIYDCMDDILEFPHIKKDYKLLNEYFEKEYNLILRSNIIFVSSQYLLQKIKSRNDISFNPILLNNAITSAFFTENEDVCNLNINDFPPKNGFIDLLYIGTISEWFDFELILKSLKYFKNIRYILIGPSGIPIPKHDRIIYLGCKKHIELISCMKRADLLVMPFLVNDLVRSVNPVKLYEYVFSGKPIITCSYSEIDQFDDFVFRYNNETEYFQLLRKLIKGELIQKDLVNCKKFVMQNTWEKRVELIMDTLTFL